MEGPPLGVPGDLDRVYQLDRLGMPLLVVKCGLHERGINYTTEAFKSSGAGPASATAATVPTSVTRLRYGALARVGARPRDFKVN